LPPTSFGFTEFGSTWDSSTPSVVADAIVLVPIAGGGPKAGMVLAPDRLLS
jgi:hypothetical protein